MSIKIIHDSYPENPRKFYDHLGTMVCWHIRYTLGDIQPKQDPSEWFDENGICDLVYLPLYLYDHSGITMSTKPFSCPWDSGQVGYIIATKESIKKIYGKKIPTKEQIKDHLQSEVKEYDNYLTDNVWGFIENEGEETEESCFGFFGSDLEETGILGYFPPEKHNEVKEAWENRK